MAGLAKAYVNVGGSSIPFGSKRGAEAMAKAICRAVEAERAACADVADRFTCGCCGMDGKAGKAIRERTAVGAGAVWR